MTVTDAGWHLAVVFGGAIGAALLVASPTESDATPAGLDHRSAPRMSARNLAAAAGSLE